MYWTVSIRTPSFKDEVICFTIDYPRTSTFEAERGSYIAIGGWCDSGEQEHEIVVVCGGAEVAVQRTNRPDVVRVMSDVKLECGFKCFVPVGHRFSVGFKVNGATTWITEGWSTVVNALLGREDFLFLDNDHNDSVAQFIGEARIANSEMSKWEHYFDNLAKRAKDLGFRHVFLLAPGKEYVFPELYPYARSGIGPAEQLLARFGDLAGFTYPLNALTAEKYVTFPKTDSHWTDYGAEVAARAVCSQLKVQYIDPGYTYNRVRKAGDLGRKFEPQKSETIFSADLSSTECLKVFDNEVNNRGWIRIFESNMGKGTCIVFGDSFSQRLVDHLALSFGRLVHVFSAADIDWGIVEAERPDFLVSEITTRFALRAPTQGFSLFDELERKAAGSDSSECRRIVRAAENSKEKDVYLELTRRAFGEPSRK